MADQSLDLTQQLESDLKKAMVARDEVKTSVIRLLKAALQNQQIELGHEISAHDMVLVLQKEAKKRHDAAVAYEEAGRKDLADAEKSEEVAITQYLPTQLTDEQLTQIIDIQIRALGASTRSDMGKVIAAVLSQTAGQADGARVSRIASEKLQG